MELEQKPVVQQAAAPTPEDMAPAVKPVDKEQLKKFTAVLREYHTGTQPTKARVIASENWWKLRNSIEEEKTTNIGKDGGFKSKSGWLHNVIVSKHADAMEAFPQPNVLPREKGDRAEATKLSVIVPCILEQNGFERTYSDAMWQKCKSGTGVYKIIWDQNKLNGLGDISIEKVSLLNVYWEPGVDDIQKSQYFFQTELVDKDVLQRRYPEFADQLKGRTFISSRFLYDDHVKTENKLTVIEVYYHKTVNGKQTLQYCRYVNDVVLHATENDPELSVTGLYDHGQYPFDFDPLFPIEGSPCGYGYVDVCMNPQTEIDLMKSSFVKNTMVGSTPRYWARAGSGVNREQFLDLSNSIVEANDISEDALRKIEYTALEGNYIAFLDRTIQELRETSGNTETSTGNISSGVTAASAIAALQEASGKGSRDSTKAAYRSFERIVKMVIELIRQFYDLPRQFRITGENGSEEYISYTNAGLQPQHQGMDFGMDMGFRLPVFDIKVSAQKESVYATVTQNELALQFFQLGFFNPQMVDQALMTLGMMDFDGKEEIMQKIAQNGTMFQKLLQYMQLAMGYAKTADPAAAEMIAQDIIQTMGGAGGPAVGGAAPQMFQSDHMAGIGKKEPANVENARSKSSGASQPGGEGAVRKEKDK